MPLKVGCVGYGKTALLKAVIKEIPEHVNIKVVEEPFELDLKKIFDNVPCETTHEAADTPQELIDKVRETCGIRLNK